MKYIVLEVKSKELHLEVPFVFPDIAVHSDMAEHCSRLLRIQFEGAKVIPVSAGFMSSMGFDDICYGESTSLNLKSRGEKDKALLNMCDYGSMVQC